MTTLTVTAEGQITLRQDLLRHLGVAPGDKVAVHKLPNGRVEMVVDRAGERIEDLRGALSRPGRPVLSEAANAVTDRPAVAAGLSML